MNDRDRENNACAGLSSRQLRGHRWIGVLGLFCLLAGGSWSLSAQAREPSWRDFKRSWPKLWVRSRPCTVYKVIDGDTVHVMCDGHKEKLRLVGIDTPETKHPFKPIEYFGPEASAKAKKTMPPGSKVWLGFGRRPRHGRLPRGKYGRLLAYVFLPNRTMFNAMMVEQGYAYAMRRYPHVYMRRFVELENRAKRAKRGMWADLAKVRATIAGDHAYRQHKRRCIRKLRLPRHVRFHWVIGDKVKKYYFTHRHRAYFRTNPYNRVLFCSVQEARAHGYQAAPYNYRPRGFGGHSQHDHRRSNRYHRPRSKDTGTDLPSDGGRLIIGDTKSQTYHVYQRGSYRIFHSIAEAKDAGYRKATRRRRRTRKRRRRRSARSHAIQSTQKPDCGGKTPIVANRRSKKYRLPGMRSYRRATRSKNAIYFCTEREAKAAGYTKSKR